MSIAPKEFLWNNRQQIFTNDYKRISCVYPPKWERYTQCVKPLVNCKRKTMARHLFILIVSIALTAPSCKEDSKPDDKSQKQKTTRTEDQKRKYFANTDSLRADDGWRNGRQDSTHTFAYFMRTNYPDIKAKNIADPFIYAFEENYIDTTSIDSTVNWLRISVAPCFRRPYCLVVEKKFDKTYLTAKMTDGDGGYYWGHLDITTTKIFSDTLYNNISKQLHQLNFWTLHEDTVCHGGYDGEHWTIEAIENGQYNIIDRWVPQHCGGETTLQLGQLGLQIRDKSKILEIFALTYGIDRKKLGSY